MTHTKRMTYKNVLNFISHSSSTAMVINYIVIQLIPKKFHNNYTVLRT